MAWSLTHVFGPMAVRKRLCFLKAILLGVSALLLFCIVAPASVKLINDGKPLCMPGVSIRCHESDCGRYFQRCGSTALLEVPEDKVCFRGNLLSTKRTDLHSCRSTAITSNSSRLQSGIGACNCRGCVGQASCVCMCVEGPRSFVICLETLKSYPSLAVAQCCLSTQFNPKNCFPIRNPWMLEIALERLRGRFTELFMGEWSLQDAASIFTFRQPLSETDACCTTVDPICKGLC